MNTCSRYLQPLQEKKTCELQICVYFFDKNLVSWFMSRGYNPWQWRCPQFQWYRLSATADRNPPCGQSVGMPEHWSLPWLCPMIQVPRATSDGESKPKSCEMERYVDVMQTAWPGTPMDSVLFDSPWIWHTILCHVQTAKKFSEDVAALQLRQGKPTTPEQKWWRRMMSASSTARCQQAGQEYIYIYTDMK